MRLGWRSLRSAFASIWRMRSRVTLNCLPTSSSVREYGVSVVEAEAEGEHLALAVGERGEHLLQAFAQDVEGRDVGGVLGGGVGEEVAEVRVVPVADGRLQRDRLLRHLEHLADAVHAHAHFGGGLLVRRLAAELLHQLLLDAEQAVDRLDHVDRDADRAGLVGDGAGGGLADPPGRVGRELVPAPVLELLDGLHEPGVALLDQVQERQAAVHVLLHDGDDEAEVRLDHLRAGLEPLAQRVAQREELVGEELRERVLRVARAV